MGDNGMAYIESRLEYLRGQLRAECISYGELAELADLTDYIDPGDVELLEPAGVPEFGPGRDEQRERFIMVAAGEDPDARIENPSHREAFSA